MESAERSIRDERALGNVVLLGEDSQLSSGRSDPSTKARDQSLDPLSIIAILAAELEVFILRRCLLAKAGRDLLIGPLRDI